MFPQKQYKYIFAIFIILGSLVGSAVFATPARAATNWIVTKAADTNDGTCDSDCSLREAVAAVTAGDTITFDSSLSGGTIYLQSTLSISTDLTIDGSTLASKITISGDSDNNGTGNVRVFQTNGNITLDSLIITKGSASFGGGIYNAGFNKTLTITNSTLTGNAATGGNGGATKTDGALVITSSTFSGNTATGTGGAVSTDGGSVTVTDSTFSANTAGSNGGGIYGDNAVTVTGSTFSANTAGSNGGGIYKANSSAVTITNSTFSANTATGGNGGGVYGSITMTLNNSTFSANAAGVSGGGVYKLGGAFGGTFNYANTIIANSSSGGDCVSAATIATNINNLVEDGSCSASLSGDPSLDSLADNGGPTQTFALLTGSPAIDAGDDTTSAASPVNNLDQRGVTRPEGAQCDIGAFEGSVADTIAPAVTSFTATSPSSSFNIPITAFTASDNIAVTGYKITESSTPPAAGDAGWSASAPTTYTVGGDGNYTLYPWAKDAEGNVSAVYGSPAGVTVSNTFNTWNALGSGLNGIVFAIGIDGTDIYAGGSFTDAGGDLNADYIAKWNGTSWSALGTGLNGTVRSIVINGEDIYVGGDFTDAGGDLNADYVAKWNSDSWSALGTGMTGSVYVVAVSGSNVYVGGSFTNASGNDSADYIAKLDGDTWGGVGSTPLNLTVYSIALSGGHVYAGGIFTDAGGDANADRIAKWNGASWTALGSGVNSEVRAIVLSGGDVYVGGSFYDIGGTPNATDFIARWNGAAWSDVGGGLNSPVRTIAIDGTDVYAGGYFTDAGGDANADYITKWNGTSWSALGTTPLDNAVNRIVINGTDLYAGGQFTDAGGDANADRIARFEIDADAPTVVSFSATSPSNSLNINITAFTASDNVAVTGYKITESSTPPSTAATGWTASAPTTYTVASQGSHILYPWVKDWAGNVSAVYGSPVTVSVDTTAPAVTSFIVPSLSASLDVPITTFTASDGISVTGYLITDSATPPSSDAAGWTASAPTTYTVPSDGSYILYPWAKDAAGHVSSVYGSPASVEVDTAPPSDTTAPSVDTFTAASTSNNLDISITDFTASDNTAVTGYLITESSDVPAAGDSGWSGVAPTIYTVAADGNYTLYPWAKDAAGNVSAEFGSPVSVIVDTTAPDVSIDSQPTDPSSSTDASFTFSSTDGTATFACDLDGAGFSFCSSPMDYTGLSDGSHTFSVQATDSVGNTGAADTYTWTISIYVASERIDNGGFNSYPTNTSKIPTSWKAAKFSPTDGKNTTVMQEGTASVRITGTGVSKTLSQTLLLTGSTGDAFTFSFWVKGKSIPTAGVCRAQILFYNGATLNPTKKTINCGNGTYAFKQRLLSFTAPGDYTKIVIKFTYSKASGRVWFDAASLVR